MVATYDQIDTKFDKLWLLVNEKTGIVEKYFFKQGIRPRSSKAKKKSSSDLQAKK